MNHARIRLSNGRFAADSTDVRFGRLVPAGVSLDECWPWEGTIGRGGYGHFSVDRRHVHAHRWAYQRAAGVILPRSLQVDHLCRNRACVNPLHLEAVTQQENIRRGLGPGVREREKTHCPRGHPYSGENLFAERDGSRRCRICRRVHVAASKRRARARRRSA